MIFIILAILCSSLNVLLFKFFEKIQVDSFQAIVFNYFTCVLAGYLTIESGFQFDSQTMLSWLPYALVIGTTFIGSFYLIALTTLRNGVSVAAIANKLSMVIPIIVAFVLYKEPATWNKIIGILLAIIAVFASSIKTTKGTDSQPIKASYLWLPLTVFLLGGTIDALIGFLEKRVLQPGDESPFLIFTFGVAAIIGVFLLGSYILNKKGKITLKNVIAGFLLGFPNYGSMYFFLKAISHSQMDQSALFPIINIGVVSFSTIAAYLIFKEKISTLNVIGIIIALFAILLMSWQ